MKIQSLKTISGFMMIPFMFFSLSYAQEDNVSQFIHEKIDEIWTSGELHIGNANIASKDILPKLYERNSFQLLWQNPQNEKDLLSDIGSIEEDGLNPEDYHLSELLVLKLQLDQSASPDPSLLADYDILLTDSLIRLTYHLNFGKVDPEALHPNWNMSREINDQDPVSAIEKRLRVGQLADALKNIRPQFGNYNRLKAALKKYREMQDSGGWETVPEGPALKPGMTDDRIPLLRQRLRISGDFRGTSSESDLYDEELKEAVISFQNRHRLDADGVVGKQTYEALNMPVKKKIDQIRANLERARWVLHKLPQEYLVVDIAGFRVYFFRDKGIAWTSRVQVGKPFRNTPVFKSKIKYMVFNPTWTVPPTILSKDILPKVKKNPAYLGKMNMKVIDRKGKFVNPNSVNWSKYSGKNVPYTFRQDPGPKNALGRIKFIFPNKHFIYLHDTPSRYLYQRKDRAFSSGCIRVEKNIELAEILLDDSDKWNQEAIQNALDTNETRKVDLPNPMPVILLYWTVRVDENGIVLFKKDVYKRDQAVLDGLNEEFQIWQRRAFDKND